MKLPEPLVRVLGLCKIRELYFVEITATAQILHAIYNGKDAITVRNLEESQMVGARKYQIITREEIDKVFKIKGYGTRWRDRVLCGGQFRSGSKPFIRRVYLG